MAVTSYHFHPQLHFDSLCRVILVVVILKSDFFQNKFHVHLNSPPKQIDYNNKKLHTIVYLQVAIISQALIFITYSHGFFFMEHPLYALMGAFCLAQLVSLLIAGFANWGFTNIKKILGSWIGIVWVWVRSSFHLFMPCVLMCPGQNIIWFDLLNLVKFAMKATIIKYLRDCPLLAIAAATCGMLMNVLRTLADAAN